MSDVGRLSSCWPTMQTRLDRWQELVELEVPKSMKHILAVTVVRLASLARSFALRRDGWADGCRGGEWRHSARG